MAQNDNRDQQDRPEGYQNQNEAETRETRSDSTGANQQSGNQPRQSTPADSKTDSEDDEMDEDRDDDQREGGSDRRRSIG